MTLRSYILLVLFATILCVGSLVFVVVNINPNEAAFLGFLLFYLSFFCSIVGVVSLVGLALRIKMTKDEPMFKLVLVSFRQAILVACVFTIAMFLQSQRLLSLASISLLIIGFICIELFLSKMQR